MLLWLKAAHIIAAIAWMAALLYLPRLLVYHSAAAVKGETSEQLKIMEKRLARAILWPAGIATWVLGTSTVAYGGYLTEMPPWLKWKLAIVAALSAYHVAVSRYARMFGSDQRPHSKTYFRILNEVPTAALVAIVVLAVVRPW
jgi:putative membrane protein